MPTFRRVARAGIWIAYRAVQISIAIKKFESDSIMNSELRITINTIRCFIAASTPELTQHYCLTINKKKNQ